MPVEAFLEQGSYALILAGLLFAGIGVPLPEDVVLMSAGALIQMEVIHWLPTLGVCAFGVLAGDLLTYTLGRKLGVRAFEHRLARKALSDRMRQRIETWFDRYGGFTVFAARHVPGLRVPVFAMAGIQGMSLRRFFLWDALGVCVSIPLLLGIGYVFRDHLHAITLRIAQTEHYLVVLLVSLAALAASIAVLRRYLGS